ncbi:hypothetical protein QJS04_geneDACA024734 [Acorus gramineus]|uniref:Uncharacterized protein n=1 Tax=Acorus gramineus TaxID=55184 RepID=A0AAV9A1S6_ACOGR|nr:hypothetical protein QJS04_geneDACA024734 [Acorus gramineus]
MAFFPIWEFKIGVLVEQAELSLFGVKKMVFRKKLEFESITAGLGSKMLFGGERMVFWLKIMGILGR